MVRPKEMDFRIPKTLSMDAQTFFEFEKLVGNGNVSEKIREWMKKEVEKANRKKEEALANPIGLPTMNKSTLDKHIPLNERFEEFENSVMDAIDQETDILILNKAHESNKKLNVRMAYRKNMLYNANLIKNKVV
jgi:hypothetical protein